VHVALRIARDRLAGISKSEFARLATHFSLASRNLSILLGALKNSLGDTAERCSTKRNVSRQSWSAKLISNQLVSNQWLITSSKFFSDY
jgi:hypothetical protein